MSAAYTMSFLFLFLLGAFEEKAPEYDYRLRPGETAPLPFAADRLSPWSADYTSRATARTDTAMVAAPEVTNYRSLVQTVASEPSNESLKKENDELRQRIQQLEQMMKAVVSQPPVSGAVGRDAGSDQKSVPGWTVEIHQWNPEGKLSPDAKETLLTENCEFTGRFAQTSPTQLLLYRFMATFRVKEAGRYVFASDLKCVFDHECGFNFFVDKQPLMSFANSTDGTRLANGVALTPGDHQLEFHTWLRRSMFIQMKPHQSYKWHVQVKAPSDLTPREFAMDELFSVIPRRLNMAPRPCQL